MLTKRNRFEIERSLLDTATVVNALQQPSGAAAPADLHMQTFWSMFGATITHVQHSDINLYNGMSAEERLQGFNHR